jgi:hypothetical protein
LSTPAPSPLPLYRRLDAVKIVETLERLRLRIDERFPDSGLLRVASEVTQVAREAEDRCRFIDRPQWWVRGFVGLVIALALLGLVGIVRTLQVKQEALDLGNWVQSAEAATSELVLLGLAIAFLVRSERRLKRKKALAALHELRALAHVIDMHQLTKDPESTLHPERATAASPKRTLTPFELSRYLDYASELLAGLGKVAALYAQHLDDEVVLASVTQIEELTTDLSHKIWQKLTILEAQPRGRRP